MDRPGVRQVPESNVCACVSGGNMYVCVRCVWYVWCVGVLWGVYVSMWCVWHVWVWCEVCMYLSICVVCVCVRVCVRVSACSGVRGRIYFKYHFRSWYASLCLTYYLLFFLIVTFIDYFIWLTSQREKFQQTVILFWLSDWYFNTKKKKKKKKRNKYKENGKDVTL